jgi:hypothetical protein
MKTKRHALYSPAATAAYFLGRAETHRLMAKTESRDIFRQGSRQMMRENALRAVYWMKQIGGAS